MTDHTAVAARRDRGRPRTTVMEVLWSKTPEGQCRVCGLDVTHPFKQYCSRWCKHVAEAVYYLYNWEFVSKWVKYNRDRHCARCGRGYDDAHADLPTDVALECDHIVPIANGGHPFAPTNLQTLCSECHDEKGLSSTDFRDDDFQEAPSRAQFGQSLLAEFGGPTADGDTEPARTPDDGLLDLGGERDD